MTKHLMHTQMEQFFLPSGGEICYNIAVHVELSTSISTLPTGKGKGRRRHNRMCIVEYIATQEALVWNLI